MLRVRRGLRLALLTGLALATAAVATAHAAVTARITFTPDVIAIYQTSTLRVVLVNSDDQVAESLNVSLPLPGGVFVAPLPNLVNTCGGAVTLAPGGTTIGVTDGTIPAATEAGPGRCEIAVNVAAAAPGIFQATLLAAAVTSTRGSPTVDTQAIMAAGNDSPITGTKAFSPDFIHGNPTSEAGQSTVTITLTNPNNFSVSGLGFTDTLPAGLLLARLPNASTNCDQANLNNPQPLATSITVTNIKLKGGQSCSIAFQVFVDKNTAQTFHDEVLTNTIPAGSMTANGHPGLTNATISGDVHIQTGAQIVKSFDPTAIASGNAATLQLEFRNYNAVPLTSISLTDNMPNPMRIANPTNAATTCPSGTVNASPNNANFSFTNGQAPAAPAGPGFGSCRVTVSVTATSSSTLSLLNQTDPNVFNGVNVGPSSATLVVNPVDSITAEKVFTGTAVQTGTVTLTIKLKNGAPAAATGTALTDDLATMGAGYTVAASPAATTTCGGTLNAPSGATTISLSNGVIPAGGTCTVTVPVQIGATAALGTRTNTIATGAITSSQGSTTRPVTASVTTVAALGVSKVFDPATVVAGQDSRLRVTITHADGAAAFTNLSFTDTLPAGHTVSTTPGVSNTCGGSVTASPGAGSFALSGGGLGTGATGCAVEVNVTSPAGSGGADTNVLAAGTVSTGEGATNGSAAHATLVRIQTEVLITKAFAPDPILSGGVSTLSVTIANADVNAVALSGATLFDLLPLGLLVATPPNAGFTGLGCAGTVTAVAGDHVVSLTGASLAIGSTCVLEVDVTAAHGGVVTNTIEAGAFHSAQGVTNAVAAAGILTVTASADLGIAKAMLDATAVPGTVVTFQVTVSNAGPDDVVGATVTDTAPPGTQFTGWTCLASAGAACTAAGAGDVQDTVTIPVGGSLQYAVTVKIDASLTGSFDNTATVTAPPTIVDVDPGNDSDTLAVPLTPTIALRGAKTDLTGTYTPGTQQTYFVAVANQGPSDATSVTVSDPLPAGVTLTAAVTCVAAGGASCGTVVGAAGGTSFGTSGAAIPAGAAHGLIFTVPVTFAASLTTDPLVNTVTANDVVIGSSTLVRSDTDIRDPQVAMAVTVDDGSLTYTPGGTATYTVTVTNAAGFSDALNLSVGDALPAGVTLAGTVTCVAGGAASCGTVSGVAGGTSFGVTGATLSAGGGNSLTLMVPVTFASNLTADPLVVSAGANDLSSGATASGSDSDTRLLDVTLAVTKSDGRTTYTPGGRGIYRIRLQNTGLSDALEVTVDDPLPAGVTLVAPPLCVPLLFATCGTVTGIAGGASLGVSGATLRGSGLGVLILVAPVAFEAGLTTDPLVNTATATDVASGDSGQDSNSRSPSVVSADLSLVKTGPEQAIAGGTITYLLTLANAGPGAADGAAFSDPVPASVTGVSADCIQATGGASCGSVSVEGNDVSGVTGALPSGGTVVIRVTGVLTTGGTVVNQATVAAPAGVADPNIGNDTGTATTEVAAVAVPALSESALALLAALVLLTPLVRRARVSAGRRGRPRGA